MGSNGMGLVINGFAKGSMDTPKGASPLLKNQLSRKSSTAFSLAFFLKL
jgi:hypothetical protein